MNNTNQKKKYIIKLRETFKGNPRGRALANAKPKKTS